MVGRRSRLFGLKVLLVISLIFYSATISLLGFTLVGLQGTVTEQDKRIATLDQQISEVHRELSFLQEEIESASSSSNPSLSEVYNRAKDSVAVVQGKIVRETFFGKEYDSVQGSGFISNYSGTTVVVTNSHVVSGATNITVSFLNGNTYPARLVGNDPYSDLAVLSADAPPSEFHPLAVASSPSLQVGQSVIAVGSPFGLQGSMTTGVISQLGRTISESATGGYLIANVIQISAPVNPGNSGGPLLNVLGEVVGITTAIVADSQGVGFAVPSDTIVRELPYLIRGEQYPHPWLGVKGVDMSFDIATAMNLKVTSGWLIVEVLPNSPAEKAGLKGGTQTVYVDETSISIGGDVITMIDGIKVRSGDDLSTYLEKGTKPGQCIEITMMRAEQTLNVTVTLGIRPTM